VFLIWSRKSWLGVVTTRHESSERSDTKGIERDISKMAYGPTSAPMIFEDLVMLGFSNDEGHPGAPGDIRAFDARTGEERWRFHTVQVADSRPRF
jgi:outer membrane protein assembly factor BamB